LYIYISPPPSPVPKDFSICRDLVHSMAAGTIVKVHSHPVVHEPLSSIIGRYTEQIITAHQDRFAARYGSSDCCPRTTECCYCSVWLL